MVIKNQNEPEKKPPGVIAQVFGGGCLLIIVIVIILILGGLLKACNSIISAPPIPFKENYQQQEVIALVACKNKVKSLLKSPSTAKFPYDDYEIRRVGEMEYQIISYVDAQNSFGAVLRSNWYCTVDLKDYDDDRGVIYFKDVKIY